MLPARSILWRPSTLTQSGEDGVQDHETDERPEDRVAQRLPPPTARIAYLDMARGLFLVLMASCHAMTLAGIPATSPLARWGLPRGWATTGLIMLCGFMIATFCRVMTDRAGIRRRVLRRAKELFVVMFASNVLMVTIRHLVSHDTEPLVTLAWWGGVLFRGTEWSVSAILLPISLFLLVSPGLVRLRDRCRSRIHDVMFAAGVLLVAASAWGVAAFAYDSLTYHHALNVIFGTGLGGFPVIPILAEGGVGFLIGTVWQPVRHRFDVRTTIAIMLFFVVARQVASLVPAPGARTLLDMSHFLIVMAVAIGFTQWRPTQRAFGFVAILGSSSLLTFLLHRILEQALNLGLTPLHLPREIVYTTCLSGGVFCAVVLILLRRKVAVYDRVLRALYL